MDNSEPPDRLPPDLNRREFRRTSAVFLVPLVIFVLSPVGQFSDTTYSLLVSECLYKHGTFALDRYIEPPLDPDNYPGSGGRNRARHRSAEL